MAEMMVGREKGEHVSAADWIRSRRERIVAAVQARKQGDIGRAGDDDVDSRRRGTANEEPEDVVLVARRDRVASHAPARNSGRDDDVCVPNVVVVKSNKGSRGGHEQKSPKKKIIVDFDNMFDDAPAAVKPKHGVGAGRATGVSKSKCVKKIEDIEKRRRERRSSAKHAMQMKVRCSRRPEDWNERETGMHAVRPRVGTVC